MTAGLLAGARAYFLLAVRLDNVDLAKTLQGPIYEIIEPRFRQFPISVPTTDPFGLGPSTVLQPLPIRLSKWQSHPQTLPLSGASQDDRGLLLIPNIVEREPIHLAYRGSPTIAQYSLSCSACSSSRVTGMIEKSRLYIGICQSL